MKTNYIDRSMMVIEKFEDEAVRIGLEGYNHVKRHHTGRKRVEYMLNVMRGIPWQQA